MGDQVDRRVQRVATAGDIGHGRCTAIDVQHLHLAVALDAGQRGGAQRMRIERNALFQRGGGEVQARRGDRLVAATEQQLAQAEFHAIAGAGHGIHVDRCVRAAHFAPVVDLAVVDVVQLLQREAVDRVVGAGDHHQAIPCHRCEGEAAIFGAAVAAAYAAGEVGRAVVHRVDAGGGVERMPDQLAVAGLLPGLGHAFDHTVRRDDVAAPRKGLTGREGGGGDAGAKQRGGKQARGTDGHDDG